MKMLSCAPCLLAVVILGLAPGMAAAERLVIPMDPPPPNSPEGVLRPVRGMHKDRVLERFGEPLQRLAPVGDPPITRWVYPQFTVYFEQQYVIQAVLAR